MHASVDPIGGVPPNVAPFVEPNFSKHDDTDTGDNDSIGGTQGTILHDDEHAND